MAWMWLAPEMPANACWMQKLMARLVSWQLGRVMRMDQKDTALWMSRAWLRILLCLCRDSTVLPEVILNRQHLQVSGARLVWRVVLHMLGGLRRILC